MGRFGDSFFFFFPRCFSWEMGKGEKEEKGERAKRKGAKGKGKGVFGIFF